MRIWVCSTQERFARGVRQVVVSRYPDATLRYIEGSPLRMVNDIGWCLAPPNLIVIDERMQGWDPEQGRQLCLFIVRRRVAVNVAHFDTNLTANRSEYRRYRMLVHENKAFFHIRFQVIETRWGTWDERLLRFLEVTEEQLREQEQHRVPDSRLN